MLGSLRNNDGDGYKNFTKNVKSRFLKLYRAFALSFNSSNVAFFFCSWILKDCIKVQEKKSKVVLCSRPPQNVKFGIFTTYSRAVTAKKRKKERDVRANFFFANLNLLLFSRSRWRRCCRCLSSLLSFPDANQILLYYGLLVVAVIIIIYYYYYFLFTGLYFYVDTYRHSSGDNAKLTFALPRNKSSYCLTFYYYMYGSGMETLNVYSGNNKIFTKSGNQGNYWKRAIRTVYLSDMVNV